MTGDGGGPRLFVAVALPDAAREAVTDLVARVRARHAGGREVRWVRLDGLHLTLRFLGPTAPDRIAAVAEAVDRSADGSAPVAIRIAGAGSFPPHGRPRALWLGVVDESDGLVRLAAALNQELAERGWPTDDRPFRAHLTLARSDGVRAGPATVDALRAAAAGLDVTATVDRLVLFESLTGGGPARYEPIHEAPLR